MTLAFLVLILNSAYLAARADPSLFYFTNVMLHVGLGLALAVAATLRWRSSWRAWPRILQAAGALLAVAALLGVALALLGATRTHAWMLRGHITTACLGAAAVLFWMAGVAVRRPREAAGRVAAAMVVVSVLAVAAAAVAFVRDQRDYAERYRIVNPAEPPQSMEGEGAGPQSPFF